MSELRKAIAVDFDGCLCHNAFPEVGSPHWDVIVKAKQEQDNGAGLILWTCREGELLQDAVNACAQWGLMFDAINESLPEWIEAFGNAPRKVGATEYWDDRARPVCDGYLWHGAEPPCLAPREEMGGNETMRPAAERVREANEEVHTDCNG